MKTFFSEKVRANTVYGISLICTFLFLYTAYSKLLEHARFLKGLSRVESIAPYAVYISWLVPASEIAVSILLIIPKTVKWGLYGFACLIVFFTVYIISALLLIPKHLPCTCGGVIENLTWPQHLWFNIGFIMLAVFALWLSNSNDYKKNLKN